MTGLEFEPWPGEPPDGLPGDLRVNGVPYARTWQPRDLTDILAGTYEPLKPTVGRRDDGLGLFYAGKAHTVASETEAGKTWFALSAALDELHAGNHVAYVDFEDDAGTIVGRLLTLGADRAAVAERFHYIQPEDALGSGINRDDLDAVLHDCAPTLAILDGVTEAMTMHGLDPLNNSDAAKFGRMLPTRIKQAGSAAVSLDHVTKSAEGRGRYSIGAVHKLNGLDGCAYTLENRTPFGIGMTGRTTVRVSKDRLGQLRRHGLPHSSGMHWLADLVVTSHSETFAEVGVEAPRERDDSWRPTEMMHRVAEALEKHGALAQRSLDTVVQGKAASIRDALRYLILDGFVSATTPHKLLCPYRLEDQP